MRVIGNDPHFLVWAILFPMIALFGLPEGGFDPRFRPIAVLTAFWDQQQNPSAILGCSFYWLPAHMTARFLRPQHWRDRALSGVRHHRLGTPAHASHQHNQC